MHKRICRKALFLVVCSFLPFAQASIPGFYILGQAGSGNTHAAASNAAAISVNSNEIFTSRVAGGYQFNQNLATEIGYTQFSDTKFSAVNETPGQDISLREKAIDFIAKFMLPLSNTFDVYGKLGFAYFKANGSFLGNGQSYLGYSDSWDPTFAVGLSYDVAPDVLVDLAWMRLQNIRTGHAIPSADFYSVGIAYYFG